MSDIRVVLLVLALSPGLVLAQSAELQPPPLVGVEEAAEVRVAPVPAEALPPRAAPEVGATAEPPGRMAGRVVLEALGGSLAGVGGGFAGIVASLPLGGLGPSCDGGNCPARGLVAGGIMGWSLGAAVGVYGAASMAEGRGRFLPTLGLGLLSGGAAAGLYMSDAVGDEAIPLLLALPLATSIVTYEVTSAMSRQSHVPSAQARESGAWWTPTVGVSSRGGSLGLTGRF